MQIEVEQPQKYSLIAGLFKIEGWAIDESKVPGAKIDYVGIYLDNKPQDGGRFISRCDYGTAREDIGKVLGDEFINSGFFYRIDSNKIEDGLIKLYIYFHSNKFQWKYDEIELFINNNNTFIFEEMLNKKDKNIELKHASISGDEDEIIIKEGDNLLKYIKFPVDIESNNDYLVSFRIKKLSDLNNTLFFDFFSDGYDDPEQEFYIKHTDIDDSYKNITMLINSGSVPVGKDIYFRIFTNSGGSIKIEDLTFQKVIKKPGY
jgi:hypothetical protein